MVIGDCYLHSPRGCNNRLDEKTANRKSNNRVFDSQNNNKGGYNVGDATDKPAGNDFQKQYQMSFFQSGTVGKSTYPVEWTHQHGCGKNTEDDPIKVDCQVILQYLCQPDTLGPNQDPGKQTIRDGTSTQQNQYQQPSGAGNRNRRTLRESSGTATNRENNNNKVDRGMQESYQWIDKCAARPRNKGLFIADQNVNGDQATKTRQNPNGKISGYECAEERDYYPYWHPSPWKDAAIIVEDLSRCTELTDESFNVKPKHECVQNFNNGPEAHYSFAETEAKCNAVGGKWREFHSYLEKLTEDNGNPPTDLAGCQALARKKNIPTSKVIFEFAIFGKQRECLVKLEKPDCVLANYSRDNHLGNVDGDSLQTNVYNWELPNFPSGDNQRCAFRMRYNISTEDYSPKLDSEFNGNKSPVKQNPEEEVGLPNGQKLRLAINTAQYGRTFQDRSHVFLLKSRPNEIPNNQNLHNLVTRGKRGNIVQTYPAVEYDFVPNRLEVSTNDAVHIQWTGSNTHNNNNPAGDGQAGDDGQGKGGTDRINVVTMKDRGLNYFTPIESDDSLANNAKVLWSAKPLNKEDPIDIGIQLASAGHYSCYNCNDDDSFRKKKRSNKMDPLLNNAPASFPGMVVQFKTAKKHTYGCSRNNNFSNRSNKGEIIVK